MYSRTSYFHLMKSPYRHGDLRIDHIDSLPKGAELTKENVILALGEVTGHKHVLQAQKSGIKVLHKDGATYFQLMEVTPLAHEDHKVAEIVPGIYRMTFEVDYNPLKRSLSQAKD